MVSWRHLGTGTFCAAPAIGPSWQPIAALDSSPAGASVRDVDTVDPALLKDVDLFRSLDDEGRAALAPWLEAEDYPAGKAIVRDDDAGYAFFVLVEGQVRAEHEGKVLEVLNPGSVFGEMAILGDGHRKASVVAETPVRVLSMFGTRFRQMQAAHPEVAARLEELARERAARVQSTES